MLSTVCPTPNRPTKFFHHVLTTIQRQWCPNTENLCISVLDDQVFMPNDMIDSSAVGWTKTLVDNRISCPRYRCSNLVNKNRSFCIHENTSSDIKPPGYMQLHRKPNASQLSSSSLADKCSVGRSGRTYSLLLSSLSSTMLLPRETCPANYFDTWPNEWSRTSNRK